MLTFHHDIMVAEIKKAVSVRLYECITNKTNMN